MSIKNRLTLTIMGITVVAVMLNVFAITAYLIYDMRRSTIQELNVTAAVTGDRNKAALTFLDNVLAEKNMELFRLTPSIQSACIYDTLGILFTSYESPTKSTAVQCPATPANLPKTAGKILTATATIETNGNAIGTVFIASDTSQIDAYVNKTLLISGTATAAVLVATLFLTIYFQRTISGPILELAATAQTITASRDYTLEAKENYPAEAGQLARAFNEMLSEVRMRDEELLEINETLEARVVERTYALEEAKKKAEAANETKSEFLRNMSHEFRTPLHALLSFSAYGIKEAGTASADQLRQYFQYIETGANRLSRLVEQVLDLAKMEHGHEVLNIRRSNMQELISKSVDMVRPLFDKKNLTYKGEAIDAALTVACDYDKLTQVVTNLIGNAIKFTPAGREISVTATATILNDQPAVAVAVIDQGVGIPEEEKELIFESFRQSSRTNNGAGGTGLGLSICKRIIDAHGGTIAAENNTNGSGATVTFVIPLTQATSNHMLEKAG